MMDNSPPNYPSSRPSSVVGLQTSQHINGLDSQEQSMTLPVLTANLQLDSGPPNSTTSLIPAAITARDYSSEYMLQLRRFLQPKGVLEENGYILQDLSESEIERKKKCKRCGKAIQKGKANDKNKVKEKGNSPPNRKEDEGVAGLDGARSELSGNGKEESHFALKSLSSIRQSSTSRPGPEPVVRCRFHDGVVAYKMWSCCGKHVSSDPCKGHEFHIPRNYSKGKLESAWKFHTTPDTYTSSTIRPAVAIDCEMGTARSGDSELIRVTLIDYFSSAILVDSLVYPDVAMEHYNTRFSGVTTGQMKLARKQGRCLMGKEQARAEVWKFVGPNTVVVGHSAHNDLTAMRWIHPVVVDTWLIESIKAKAAKTKAEQEKKEPDSTSPVSINVARKPKADQQKRPKKRGKGSGALSLKTLTMARCGREIQTAGKKGHDSLEDATAARDLAHWNIVNKGF